MYKNTLIELREYDSVNALSFHLFDIEAVSIQESTLSMPLHGGAVLRYSYNDVDDANWVYKQLRKLMQRDYEQSEEEFILLKPGRRAAQ